MCDFVKRSLHCSAAVVQVERVHQKLDSKVSRAEITADVRHCEKKSVALIPQRPCGPRGKGKLMSGVGDRF